MGVKMTVSLRRVVTGHDDAGRAVVLSDGPVPRIITPPGQPGLAFQEIWATFASPAPVTAREAEPTLSHQGTAPPHRGTVIRIVDIPPETDSGDEHSAQGATGILAAVGLAHHAGQRHPLMHRTQTIDYGIVLSGEIVLMLDEEDVVIRAGDVVVQRGTIHAWSNQSDKPCRIAFVLVDGIYEQGLASAIARREADSPEENAMSDATPADAAADLRELILASTSVNDPFLGEASPEAFRAGSMLWPGERWSRIRLLSTCRTPERVFREYLFTPAGGGRDLPVGFMEEKGALRVYSDHHLVEERGPILEPKEGIHPWKDEDDVLYTYFKLLNGGEIEPLLDLFEEGGYFRHSNGDTFATREALRGDFTKMMNGQGIRIKYCQFTDDGKTCAVESYMPSGRPAVATYERGAPGRLHAVRIYL